MATPSQLADPGSGQAVPAGIAPKEGSAEAQQNPAAAAYGPNFEKLEELNPKIVGALRDLVKTYKNEAIAARRHEIRRIRKARMFWQGEQYAVWDDKTGTMVPFIDRLLQDDRSLEEMPRYQFVTNFYQAFGLSFLAVISQDVPSVRFYPQSIEVEGDILAAKAASDVAALVEENNRVEQMLTVIGYHLWNDGKLGAYVRYVTDGPRFGWKDEPIIEAQEVEIAAERLACPQCGAEEPFTGEFAVCPQCGTQLGPPDVQPRETIQVPKQTGTRRVAKGQEVISIIGGLELNTPVYAGEMHEFPYLQWQAEVHKSKVKGTYPHVATKLEATAPASGDDVYARTSRLAVSQGLPVLHPGDALRNLITLMRTWIRPWAFMAVEDKAVRDQLFALFPEGCYVAFAGDTYCEARNESMDDRWRVLHAFPGDGQNRPSVGDSLVQVQERYNVESNIRTETYEYGIPPIYADPQVLDFDALANQVAEPAAHYPARARPGQPLAAGFFQAAAAEVPRDMLQHEQELFGPIAQFLSGLFPAVFGGNMEDVKTASGYAMARDQAIGRLGVVWRRVKNFYADTVMLAVDAFRKNRPEDVQMPILGEGGEYEAKWIRLADLKGNIEARAEADETFPRLKSQQRGVLQQLMALNDPVVAQALAEPANLGWIKNTLGLTELVVPGEDSRNKQLREIGQLVASAPIQGPPQVDPETGAAAPGPMQSTVQVNALLDDHGVEFEECKRWANSEAGQKARAENPQGFANVQAHAAEHEQILMQQQMAQAAAASQAAGKASERSV